MARPYFWWHQPSILGTHSLNLRKLQGLQVFISKVSKIVNGLLPVAEPFQGTQQQVPVNHVTAEAKRLAGPVVENRFFCNPFFSLHLCDSWTVGWFKMAVKGLFEGKKKCMLVATVEEDSEAYTLHPHTKCLRGTDQIGYTVPYPSILIVKVEPWKKHQNPFKNRLTNDLWIWAFKENPQEVDPNHPNISKPSTSRLLKVFCSNRLRFARAKGRKRLVTCCGRKATASAPRMPAVPCGTMSKWYTYLMRISMINMYIYIYHIIFYISH